MVWDPCRHLTWSTNLQVVVNKDNVNKDLGLKLHFLLQQTPVVLVSMKLYWDTDPAFPDCPFPVKSCDKKNHIIDIIASIPKRFDKNSLWHLVSHFKHRVAACGTIWCQEAGLFDFVPKVVIELIRSRQAQGQKIFEGFVKTDKRASKIKWLVKDCSMLQYSVAYNLKFQEGNNKRVLLVVLLWADATSVCSAYACTCN